ncbi:MAG: glycosyltransferase family 4 protein [Candidatus Margulisiibacteriota bacterium]|jgi:spore coat protein SA
MKKIAVVCSDQTELFTPRQGAVSSVVINLNSQLSALYDIRTYCGGPIGRWAQDYYQLKVSKTEKLKDFVRTLREPGYPYLKKVAEELNAWRPDIVHIHNRPHHLLWLKKLLTIKPKFIIHEHNDQVRDCFRPAKAREILRAADRFVGVSRFIVDYTVKEKYPEFTAKCKAVINGVDTELFTPLADDLAKAVLRKKLGLPQFKTVILFTGAMRERKGVHHLLAAFIKLAKERPNICLVLAGDNETDNKREDHYLEALKRSAKVLPEQIFFTGYVAQESMPELYQTADIYCAVPEWQEPLGLVFLESQSAGLPVVASRTGGVPETMIDGRTGFLVDLPIKTDALVEKLQIMVDNPLLRELFGEQARKHMLHNFTWECSAKQMMAVYEGL